MSVTPLACSVAAVAKMMKIGDDVRDAHPDHRVGPDAGELRAGLPRRATERTGTAPVPVLHLQRRLPEEQVRADRGAEDRHQSRRAVGTEAQVRDEGREDRASSHGTCTVNTTATYANSDSVSHFRTPA